MLPKKGDKVTIISNGIPKWEGQVSKVYPKDRTVDVMLNNGILLCYVEIDSIQITPMVD